MSHSESDPATWNEASETVDFAAEIDSREDQFREVIDRRFPGGKPSRGARDCILGMIQECMAIGRDEDADGGSVGALLVKLTDILTMSHSPVLVLECLRFCFNLQPESQTQIAARHKVTRANVSRICVQICESLGVPPGRGMKSEEAREIYRERANGVHTTHSLPERYEDQWSDWGSIVDMTFDNGTDLNGTDHHHPEDRQAA